MKTKKLILVLLTVFSGSLVFHALWMCVCVCLDQCSFIMSIFFPTTLEMLLHCSLHSIFYDKKSTIDVNVDKSHNCEKL